MNQPNAITILYIDDEPNNLNAFKAGFRRHYNILTALSAAEGMKILNNAEQEIQIIIADQKMPQVTGVDFFNIVRKSHPNPIRILLTGYTDAEDIVDAINKGEIYRYLKKPWEEFEIHNTVQNAYEIYQTRKQLHTKIVELQKANDELNRFVYSTSHDLRAPLASITGIINLARMENSIQDPNNYIEMIESCVTRMDSFILKIIEYYKSVRAEEENLPIHFEPMVENAIENSRMQNPAITIQKEIHQPVAFLGDEYRISIILSNLISNAVKYQKPSEPSPFIKIEVEVTEKKAVIKVSDNGIGILPEQLQNVFRMFFRGSNNVTGLGIGLYIVKEAVAHLGGTISVDSVYGEGTTFHLQIPNKAAQTEPEYVI